MNILVPNLGSTSLKYQVLEMPSERVLARGRFERVTDDKFFISVEAGDPRYDVKRTALLLEELGASHVGTVRE